MKTYINKAIKGYFINYTEEIDAEYWAGQIGTTYEDFEDGKWVLLSEEQVLFHQNNPTASVEEVLNMTLILPVNEKTLEQVKEEKLEQLYEYDSSDSVNGFIVNGIESWFTAAERTNFRASIDSAKILNMNTVTFFVKTLEITISIQEAENLLAQIQNYADTCFLETKRHEIAIKALNTIEEVDNYNFKVRYPTKLEFTIELSKEPE